MDERKIRGSRGGSGFRIAGLLVGLVMASSGLMLSAPAGAGIANTKHNLGSTSGASNNRFSGTGEICVFCHTPHGSDTSAEVPLWNRKLNATPQTTYTTYDSLGTSTLQGRVAVVGSVSIACLSCHDGTQAMDTVINAPGSGGFNAAGARMTGTWTSPNGSIATLASGQLTAGIAALGTDLRNDHPIGIQYAGGGYSATGTAGSWTGAGTVGNDPDFTGVTFIGTSTVPIWYINSNGTAGRQKTDMQLYTRNNPAVASGAGTIAGYQPYVECASCHDPHTDAAPTFLRTSNTGSAVCLACHTK